MRGKSILLFFMLIAISPLLAEELYLRDYCLFQNPLPLQKLSQTQLSELNTGLYLKDEASQWLPSLYISRHFPLHKKWSLAGKGVSLILEKHIEQKKTISHLLKNIAKENKDAIIILKIDDKKLPRLSQDFQIISLGPSELTLADEHGSFTIPFAIKKPFYSAANYFRANATLTPADLDWKWAKEKKGLEYFPAIAELPESFQLKRPYAKDQLIVKSDIKLPPLIKSGDALLVHFNKGGIRISLPARSLGAAAKGENFPVFILSTGKRFKAVLISKEEAYVIL